MHRRGAILFANERARRLFGLPPPAQLAGRDVRDFVEPVVWQQLEADSARAELGELAVRGRAAHELDGAPIVIETHALRIGFEGAPATVVVVRDVSELESARSALEASEARYRTAIAAMAEGVTVRDAAGRLVATNDAAREILGLRDEHLDGRVAPPPGWRLLAEDGRTPLTPAARDAVVRGGQSVRGLRAIVERADGTRRDVSLNLLPLRRADGALDGMIATVVDVTAERLAQARALDEARLRGLRARMNEAELVFLEDGRLLDGNDRACELYGYTRDELGALTIRDLRAEVTHGDIEGLRARVHDGGVRFETLHRRKDGSVFPVEVSSRPFLVGDAHYHHSLVRDLTDARRVEAERRMLAGLIANMSDAVVVTDAERRIVEFTGNAEAVYGWPRDEVIGRDLVQGFETEFPAGDGDAITRAIAEARPVRSRLRGRRKDGGWSILDVAGTPLRADDGTLHGWLAVARDVAAEERAQRALAASEANLRAVLGQLPDAVLVHGAGGFVFANDAAAELLGFDAADQILGREHADVILEEDLPTLRGDLVRLEAGGAVARRRHMRRRDGSVRVAEVHASAVVFEGEPAKVAVLRDVTALDAAREALREREERLRSIVTAMAEGVVMQGQDGGILFANEAAERILGLSRAQLEGRTSYDPRWRTVREDGSELPGAEHPAMVTLRTGVPQSQVVFGVHTPEGALRWISVSTEPLRAAPDERPYAVVTTFADVTALRRTTEELREALRNVKTLTGFIPICMFCKKVRMNEGGYWQRLERYLGEHTDAHVSHGLCPECAKEHYPDECDDEPERR